MKKWVRNLIISGAAILAIGTVIFIIGMTAIKWDFTRLDATEYTERVYQSTENDDIINSVVIDVFSFGVEVKSGESVSLEYYEASDSEVSVGVENGALKIYERQKPGSWFTRGIFNLGRMDRKFVLTVPSGLPIDVAGGAASLDMHGIVTDSITADCTNLTMKLSDCEISDLKLHSTNLHVTVDDCAFGGIDFNSTNLTVKMTSTECESLKIRSVNVTVKVNDSSADAVTVDGTNTNLVLENVTSDSVNVDGTNNHCRFEGLTVNKVKLDGINLNATVKIKGVESEYTVITDGDRVDGTDPEKLLTFDGTNLSVQLSFI